MNTEPSATQVVAGIDGGSTKTAVRLETLDGVVLAEIAIATSPNLYSARDADGVPLYPGRKDEASEQIANKLEHALQEALEHAHVQNNGRSVEIVAACIGTAGIDAPGDLEAHRDAFLRAPTLAPLAQRLHVMSDVEIIAGCSNARVRICLIAGTGSNCLGARFENGVCTAQHQVGGMDLPLSDFGSAAWLGDISCALALQHVQGMLDDYETQIGPRIYQALGIDLDAPDGWRMIRTRRASIPKEELAKLARVVSELADNGDEVALGLLHRAAADLVAMVEAALRKLGSPHPTDVELLTVGGMWNNSHLRDHFQELMLEAGLPVGDIEPCTPTVGATHFARALLN